MSEEIKKVEEVKKDVKKEETKVQPPKMREILILTDGNNVELKKAEVNGKIEMIAILQTLINALSQQK